MTGRAVSLNRKGTAAGAGSRSVRIRAEKKRAIMLVAVFLLAVFTLVGMRSYAAILQHENNVLTEQNAMIQAEIDSLNSQIVEETKVTRIEKIATDDYGMVYPSSENCIKLGSSSENGEGLASVIRNEAYR